MSNNNYISALMMQDPYVRNIHVKMALQQFEMLEIYNEFITKMGWTFTPDVSIQEQLNTFQHYEHILYNCNWSSWYFNLIFCNKMTLYCFFKQYLFISIRNI